MSSNTLQPSLNHSEPPMDYFMYSIHNIVKDEAPTQLAEEPSADMMCMFDDFYYWDNLPKCDQYDDDHEAEIDVDCSKQPTACRW
jgi:hypothetical protein